MERSDPKHPLAPIFLMCGSFCPFAKSFNSFDQTKLNTQLKDKLAVPSSPWINGVAFGGGVGPVSIGKLVGL